MVDTGDAEWFSLHFIYWDQLYLSAALRKVGCNLIAGDFNGDGKTDIIRQAKGYWDKKDDDPDSVTLYLSAEQETFAKFNRTDMNVTGAGTPYRNYWRFDPGCNLYAGDFNGDGLSDILRQERDDWDDDEAGSAIVYYTSVTPPVVNFSGIQLTSTGALTDPQNNLRTDPGTVLIPGDYNGDKKCDFIRQERGDWDDDTTSTVQVYFATATLGHFNSVELTSAGHNTDAQSKLRFDPGCFIIPGDFNLDGRCDFIRQESNAWATDTTDTFLLYTSNGDGSFDCLKVGTLGHFLNPKMELSGNVCHIAPFDFDGDGGCDFLRQASASSTMNGVDGVSIYFSCYVE
jgi:hypothetical protein